MTNQSEMQSNNSEFLQSRINSAIQYFLSNISAELLEKLDYSTKSLDFFEVWLLKRFKDEFDFLDESNEKFINGLVFYVGETYRKHLGGYWDFSSEQVENLRHSSRNVILRGFYHDEVIAFYYKLHYVISEHVDDFPDLSTLKQDLESLVEIIKSHRNTER